MNYMNPYSQDYSIKSSYILPIATPPDGELEPGEAIPSPVKRLKQGTFKTPNQSPKKLSKEALKNLRYAQSSMKDTTGDGLPIEQMVSNMKTEGYKREYAMNVVIMPPGSQDSPLKPSEAGKMVAFDTRRTKAAREAAKQLVDEEFHAFAQIREHHEPAEKEYRALEHLTFENKKIPQHIRKVWIKEWNRWHSNSRLEKRGITPKTWGHLIVLRMAMSMEIEKSDKAETHAGFKESPFVRKTRQNNYQKNKPLQPKF
jgi:hypothetical protein